MTEKQEEELRGLVTQREAHEKEIAQLGKTIQAINEAKNYEKGLVDEEGFPRKDLDFAELADYKDKKRRFNELNNDYKALMKEIEKKLFALHSTYKGKEGEEQKFGEENKETTEPEIIDPEKQKRIEEKQRQLIEANKKLSKKKNKMKIKLLSYCYPFAK
mmetsp:Transcript_35538/g.32033  ORF Transcript_35538/g.32033 Transcript_35538/m.32033 type:complete len:160 (-) Transcript_35538:323-802(-)